MLEGELNPGASKAEVRWYFTYGDEGSCTGAGSTEEQAAEGEPNHLHESVKVTGLQPSREYMFCLDATDVHGTALGEPVSFTTEAAAPAIDAESATGVTQTDARLGAQINPENQETSWQFKVGASTSYTPGTFPLTPGILTGFGDQEASIDLAHEGLVLQANTEYHYEAIATDATGSTEGLTVQGDQTFTTLPTPPVVSTGGSAAVTTHSANVTGTVNPNNSGQPEQDNTRYYFEYGQDTSYGKRSFPEPEAIGEGTSPVAETNTLGGLTAGRTYHYRIVASNDNNGTPQLVYGQDETFTTAGTPLTPPSNGSGEAPPQSTSSTSTAAVFPNLTGIVPVAFVKERGEAAPSEVKSLTRAQKLKKALKACGRSRGAKRLKCERRAHARYGKTTNRKGK